MDMILSGKSRLFSAVHGDAGKPGALEASNNQKLAHTHNGKAVNNENYP
jgi:hypothetical protein